MICLAGDFRNGSTAIDCVPFRAEKDVETIGTYIDSGGGSGWWRHSAGARVFAMRVVSS